MKRKEYTDSSRNATENPIQTYIENGGENSIQMIFPTGMLNTLEKYLNDKDVSALSRCCKPYMIVCYLRIARRLGWGRKKSKWKEMGFPIDPFLQMQMSKVILQFSRMTTVRQQLAQKNEEEEEKVERKWEISYDDYMKSVCFIDPAVFLEAFYSHEQNGENIAEAVTILTRDN